MPTYEYRCKTCEHFFSKFCPINDRNDAVMNPCPECGERHVEFIMGAPAIGDPVRLGIRRPDGGFKEVLQKIDQSTPGSRLKTSSSFI